MSANNKFKFPIEVRITSIAGEVKEDVIARLSNDVIQDGGKKIQFKGLLGDDGKSKDKAEEKSKDDKDDDKEKSDDKSKDDDKD